MPRVMHALLLLVLTSAVLLCCLDEAQPLLLEVLCTNAPCFVFLDCGLITVLLPCPTVCFIPSLEALCPENSVTVWF